MQFGQEARDRLLLSNSIGRLSRNGSATVLQSQIVIPPGMGAAALRARFGLGGTAQEIRVPILPARTRSIARHPRV